MYVVLEGVQVRMLELSSCLLRCIIERGLESVYRGGLPDGPQAVPHHLLLGYDP